MEEQGRSLRTRLGRYEYDVSRDGKVGESENRKRLRGLRYSLLRKRCKHQALPPFQIRNENAGQRVARIPAGLLFLPLRAGELLIFRPPFLDTNPCGAGTISSSSLSLYAEGAGCRA
jgi:hypothetical protein